LEIEGPGHHRSRSSARQIIELGNGSRVLAVVGYLRQNDIESQQEVALARPEYTARLSAIGLLQPVLDIYGLARELREIYYHVGALSHTEPHATDLDRLGQ